MVKLTFREAKFTQQKITKDRATEMAMATALSQSRALIEAALTKGRTLDLKPPSVVVLDPWGAMVAMMSEDGVSQMRARIAHGRANAAIALGMGGTRRADESC